MKKFIAGILLVISMFSFFILYNDYKEETIFNMKNVEHHLENSYRVTIPTKINTLPNQTQYDMLVDSEDDASLYFTRIDQDGDNEKIIKYIYTTNNDYVNSFKLAKGKVLDTSLMYSDYFMSTEDTGDPNQIGQIAGIDGMELEIRTLQSMVDDGYYLDGACTVVVENGNIDSFLNIFKEGLGIENINVCKSYDIGQVDKKSNFQIPALFLIFMMLILYYIIKSYKKIAIEKLMGFSNFDIWKKRILKILGVQILAIIVSILVMSLILIKEYNYFFCDFLKYIFVQYFKLICITFIVASIPFIYIINIKISEIIKNKKQVKEIIILNSIIKIILCVIFIYLVNIQVENYDNIKKAFDGSYKGWEDGSNYRVLKLNRLDEEKAFSDEYLDGCIEIYKYFNKKGAIFAEFEMYSNLSKEQNSDFPEYLYRAIVNPNYLEINKVYDCENNIVKVNEDNKNWVLLIPEKYKNYEDKIREYYQFWIDSYNGEVKSDIEIIWIKNNQKLFSYNFSVNEEEGNYVTDPILFVGTVNGGFPDWNTQVFNIMGNPLKIKIEDDKSDTEEIMPILDELGYSSYGVQINYANEQVISSYNDYMDMFKWLITGFVSTLVVIIIILIENIYNYVEQFKVRFALRKLNGYGVIARYKEYLISIILSWIIIFVVSLIFKLTNISILIKVCISGVSIEIIISLIILTFYEDKKIIDFIKGGI